MKKGTVSKESPECTSFQTFQRNLYGQNAQIVTISGGKYSYSCKDPSLAKQIVDAFAASTHQTFRCNGQTWQVGGCGGGEITVGSSGVFNCDGLVSVRPCIGNTNWGGSGQLTCSGISQKLSIDITLSGNYNKTLT